MIEIKNLHISDLKYWDVNDLYGCVISQKLPVKNIFFKVHVKYFKILHDLYDDLLFFPE